MGLFGALEALYSGLFRAIQSLFGDWFLGLSARLVFGSVLFTYFINSALTKVESGFPGIFIPTMNAFAQIAPQAMEAANFDATQLPFFPHGLMVYAGTYAEFALPVLILIGLFTRAARLGMIAFIGVMTFVDITQHNVDAETIGTFFDRIQNSAIADQRLLWVFPLLYLVIRGPGFISLDALLGRMVRENPI
ncbi:MAG: DoxX family protein [Pseudomonadota bacterium]